MMVTDRDCQERNGLMIDIVARFSVVLAAAVEGLLHDLADLHAEGS